MDPDHASVEVAYGRGGTAHRLVRRENTVEARGRGLSLEGVSVAGQCGGWWPHTSVSSAPCSAPSTHSTSGWVESGRRKACCAVCSAFAKLYEGTSSSSESEDDGTEFISRPGAAASARPRKKKGNWLAVDAADRDEVASFAQHNVFEFDFRSNADNIVDGVWVRQ